ncbi:glycoside hydrolase family 15 protein [Candidatus Nomurabacteria bacterium]|nr:glycoside hydrolase family 15 protein [Candidatus Nomurabacteria bacterium]
MSRALVLGNGQILVNLDTAGQVRDFYFPHVGLENQLGGHYVHRVGVFVDGRLSWTSDDTWKIKIDYEDGTFASNISAVNERFEVSIMFNDLVYNEKNIFVRKLIVKNMAQHERDIKIFFAQQFELYESHAAHTAYFDPNHHAVIHYRNQRAFLVNARLEGKDFDDYSTGIFETEGKEGTHTDAFDGILSQNPIEHGRADSVIGLSAKYQSGEEKTLYYWLTVGRSITEVLRLNYYVVQNSPSHLVETTRDFWRAWVSRQNWSFHGLSKDVISLFQKSLFIIRAHADSAGGIVASTDFQIFQQGGRDTYNYVWPRDAAFAALALARAGDLNVARRFFMFCNDILDGGEYLMHKYSPDKSLGSSWHPWMRDGRPELPIQEDETALVLSSLWQYYQISKDIEFIEEIYNSLIKATADFMVIYRDLKTGLPRPSYNLWEEKFGVSVFTASAVFGALEAASRFAKLLGKEEGSVLYQQAASEVRDAILRDLYDEKTGFFFGQLIDAAGGAARDEIIDLSSVHGISFFGILPPSDPRLVRASVVARDTLAVHTSVGGFARYQNDGYGHTGAAVPGNPWFITTLWLAQYEIRQAKNEEDLASVKDTLDWVAKHASEAGILSEQLNPETGGPLSATPLVWSHAEFVNTLVLYLDKLEELGVCKSCNPVY